MTFATNKLNDLNLVAPPAVLAEIEARTRDMGFDMASEPRTGALLRALAALKPGGRLLELGTGTGVATAWILAGMDTDSTLVSVDSDPDHQRAARECLGNDSRLTLVLEDALGFLKRQPAASYGFVFADAIPGKYEGLEECLKVVKPGGVYVVDDMALLPKWPRAHVERVAHLISQLAGDDRFAIAPLDWSTGVIVAVRR
ncbi:MAG: O-methyltransferase [Limisphaerales bacterium]